LPKHIRKCQNPALTEATKLHEKWYGFKKIKEKKRLEMSHIFCADDMGDKSIMPTLNGVGMKQLS